MAIEVPGFCLSMEAGADLSAKQHFAVKLNSSGQVVAIAAVTDRPFAILQDKPAAQGRAASLMFNGVSKMVAGANLATGDEVTVDNTGRAVAAIPGTDTTKRIFGIVIGENSTTNGLVSVLFDMLNSARGA